MKAALKKIKKLVRSLAPSFAIRLYHLFLAHAGALRYGYPTRRMVVIGVVGTRGKTTVGNFIWSCLTSAGYKVGLTGTANIRVGNTERMNPYHMTMPGRFRLQKILREMADAGCQFAVVETPSEGVEQFRHKGVFYDCVVLTKLYPEYLEIHGWSFDRAKEMDEVPFVELMRQPRKKLNSGSVPKVIVVDAEAEEKERFLKYPADVKLTYGCNAKADIAAEAIEEKEFGSAFTAARERYEVRLPGVYNVQNALAAVAVSLAFGVKPEYIRKGLLLDGIPGRMERIELGQPFQVYVDYAHDAVSLESVLEAAAKLKGSAHKLIVLFGGQGGGRDVKKLPVMGEVSAKLADTVILTTDDPFDEDPLRIMEVIAPGAEKYGKKRGEDLLMIVDRREAVRKAFSLAGEGDVVLIAGKGAEQSMVTKAGNIPWDDRAVAREELKNRGFGVA
jgi:UDP-N-acetylmuramoyl-L-alanyl-D-glutamate--2,6-diaminopimelate ligase